MCPFSKIENVINHSTQGNSSLYGEKLRRLHKILICSISVAADEAWPEGSGKENIRIYYETGKKTYIFP